MVLVRYLTVVGKQDHIDIQDSLQGQTLRTLRKLSIVVVPPLGVDSDILVLLDFRPILFKVV